MIFNTVYHLARADFLERIRGKGIIITIILIMYLSYLFVPPNSANYAAIVVSGKRLSYTSAGIGLMFGLTISLFVSLFAFYLVKNAIRRDRETHVGQVIATTPTSKVVYLVGKWASNLALLLIILFVMTLMAPVMQLLRGESTVFNIWQIVLPIWMIGLPVMSLVAGIAILFESISFLRGGFGNIVYFFIYCFALFGMAFAVFESGLEIPDPFGISHPLTQIFALSTAEDPDTVPDLSLIGTIDGEEEEKAGVRQWQNNSWSGGAIAARFAWLMVGMMIAAGSSIFFDRFNPEKAGHKKQSRMNQLWQRARPIFRRPTKRGKAISTNTQLTPLSVSPTHFRFGTILLAELRLTLQGQPWWWFAGVLGFIIFGLRTPVAESSLVVYAAVWPVLVWSSLGAREKQNRTGALIFTTPHPLINQLPAAWLSGVVVALLVMSGFILRLTVSGAFLPVLGILAAALLIPALALALGVWSGSSRLFEVVYLCWWYIAINAPEGPGWLLLVPVNAPQTIPAYLLATIIFLALAILGRKR